MVIMFYTINESIEGLFKHFILRFYSSIGGQGEKYGFSKVDFQTMIWRKKEIMTFGNIIRSFYAIMAIAKKLQSLVSSTTLIMYRSSYGLENRVTWAWEWNLGSEKSNYSRLVSIGPN